MFPLFTIGLHGSQRDVVSFHITGTSGFDRSLDGMTEERNYSETAERKFGARHEDKMNNLFDFIPPLKCIMHKSSLLYFF